ncbi:MAG: 4-hydroxythreonine-4-phosphate dehydrogenase PdxA, partial [Gemmatimonadales bacterium]|nr:4-hydroxythreonine-4-phosphate dehydrogenase PdxA [Gemmatimonadales bacterium]
MTQRVRLAVTLGDPRGIGPEVVAAALARGVDAEITVIGAREQLSAFPQASHQEVGSWKQRRGAVGARSVEAGLLAGRAVERAAALALSGQVDAIVTAPVEKHALHLAGFLWPGHTEWLAHLAGGVDAEMAWGEGRGPGGAGLGQPRLVVVENGPFVAVLQVAVEMALQF